MNCSVEENLIGKQKKGWWSSEFSLRIPVANWMLSRGLSPVLECQSLGNCDIVGIRFDRKPLRLTELVAVELKLFDIGSVRSQCVHHRGRPVTETWAAMPICLSVSQIKKFKDMGIGLLHVEPELVTIISEADRFNDCELSWWKNLLRRREEYKWRMKDPLMNRANAIARRIYSQKNATTIPSYAEPKSVVVPVKARKLIARLPCVSMSVQS